MGLPQTPPSRPNPFAMNHPKKNADMTGTAGEPEVAFEGGIFRTAEYFRDFLRITA